MAYIRSDGTVVQGGVRPPLATDFLQRTNNFFWGLSNLGKAVTIVLLAVACRQWLRVDPFANGRIPAAFVEPNQHWKRIKEDDLFVRTMSEPLGKKTYWKGQKEAMRRLSSESNKSSKNIDILLGHYDRGGPDGHIAESGDWADLKYVQGTRCTTTRSAITAYFCGATIAENQDAGLAHENQKPSFSGVKSFQNYLSCRHQEGLLANGTHRRSVYRIGIGSNDSLAGYSHAFSLIAQPDGTYYWLQSFIGEYSLPQWMSKRKKGSRDESPYGQLSFEELEGKLNQILRLMSISSWTAEANQDYLDLFGVDKMEAGLNWNPDHRLDYFVWDEACEYPLPLATSTGDNPKSETNKEEATSSTFDWRDKCVIQAVTSRSYF